MTTSRIAAIAASTALIAGGLVIAGCGDSGTTSVPTEAEGAAYSDVSSANGSGEASLTVTPGGRFVVRLDCSPGTGYQWKVKSSGDTVLSLKSETECTPDDKTATADGAVGWSGHQFRTYDVTAKGTEVLTYQWVGPGKDTPDVTQTNTIVSS